MRWQVYQPNEEKKTQKLNKIWETLENRWLYIITTIFIHSFYTRS
jgi:hypothetical protein